MTWPLRRKLFVAIGAGAAGLALVMSLLLDLAVVDQIHEHEERGLLQTEAAFDALQRYRKSQLLERARLVSELPYFKAAAAVYDPTLPPGKQTQAVDTVVDIAQRIVGQMDVDLLTLTGIDGVPFLSVGPAAPDSAKELAPLVPIARDALRRVSSEGYLVHHGALIYVIAVQVEVGGIQLGALGLGTRFDEKLANSLEEMTGSGVALLGNDGVLALSGRIPERLGAGIHRDWKEAQNHPLGHERMARVELDGASYRTLHLPLRDPEGGTLGSIVILRSESEALAFLANVRRGLVLIASVAILVALVFSFLFSRHITDPLHELMRFTDRVSRGDLEARVTVTTRDELSRLGESFNRMAQSLAESRSHLQASNRVLEERGRELETANRDLVRQKEETDKVNRALAEAHAQLIQAGKMAAFGELGAGIAHELRQPLASIRGFAQLLTRKLTREEGDGRRYLDLIVQSVDHMTTIVQGLKDFARQSSFEMKDVDVNSVLERTAILLEGQLRSRRIRMVRDLESPLPAVRGESNQLQQVFTNLLANARDVLEAQGGTVTLRTRSLGNGSYILVSVADDGPGIPPEVLPKIFQSFFTTKPEGKGTGLGLSITQGIVHDHGGRIDVSSRRGESTVFRVFLPTVQAKNCWETIDCVKDCRPEIAGKEECAIYRERRGHRCWESLRELGRTHPEVTQPACERCPVYMQKTTFITEAGGNGEIPKAA